jgi:hypothetical protein
MHEKINKIYYKSVMNNVSTTSCQKIEELMPSAYLFSALNIKRILMIKLKALKFIDAKTLKGPESAPMNIGFMSRKIMTKKKINLIILFKIKAISEKVFSFIFFK